jgi:hypothetical protein
MQDEQRLFIDGAYRPATQAIANRRRATPRA